MSFKSDYSEDTDEFIEKIRTEIEQHDVMEEDSYTPVLRGARLSGLPLEHELFPRESPLNEDREYNDVGDISKLSYTDSTLEGYLTDDEYELEQGKVFQEVDFDLTPVNATPHYRLIGSERLQSYQQLGVAYSSPDLFQTPMHFPKTPAANKWDDNEIEKLRNKINRQTLSHKSELDEQIHREKNAQLKLAKSHHENQLLMKGMKIQLSKLQQKIREMQSEKVQLVSECKQQAAPKEEVVKFKEIAEHYKCIVNEQDSKVLNLEQLTHDLSADINQLNSRLSEKEKEIHDLNEKLKEQAREFASSQSKKQTEAQDNLNKSQKLHHREKVLSVAKIQDDLFQTHNEEVYQLKNSLVEEKNRALSRLEESFTHKLTKSDENSKKLEKEAKSFIKKIEEKDDVIKNLEIQHKKEVHSITTLFGIMNINMINSHLDTRTELRTPQAPIQPPEGIQRRISEQNTSSSKTPSRLRRTHTIQNTTSCRIQPESSSS